MTSQQASLETATAGIKVAQANEQAQQATVDRLLTLTQFENVVAPFDGIITTRGVDVGDLVNADSKTGNPLFTVAKDAIVRVTVHIPQTNAVAIRDGLEAKVIVPQMPSRTFTGKIARSLRRPFEHLPDAHHRGRRRQSRRRPGAPASSST